MNATGTKTDSSTNVMANFVLAKAGLKPSDVSIIGVGTGNGAVAAMRSGQIDAISNLDPVISLLTRSNDLKIVSDTRIVAEADKVFGGPMPAACLYLQQGFVDKHPRTAQALANAIVRANQWVQQAGAADIIKTVPETYLLGDRAVYIDAFLAAKGALSPDGSFPEKGADTAFRALASIDPESRSRNLGHLGRDLSVDLSAAQMLAIILQPIEAMTLQPRKLGIQNGIGEITGMAGQKPAAGQGAEDQVAGFGGRKTGHRALLFVRATLGRTGPAV